MTSTETLKTVRYGLPSCRVRLTWLAIRQLILLNCIIHSQEEDIVFDIPQQRLVFFVKHMDDALNNVELPLPIISEILKALTIVLPPIKEIYGSFWKTLLEVAYTTQTNGNALNDDDFPSLHARLRLLETLYRLREEGSNDDLEDAWDGSKELVASGLLSLLSQSQRTYSTSSNFFGPLLNVTF